MAARQVALLLLACAVLPAAGQSSPRAPDLDDLDLDEFKALLRYESYAEAGCAVKGGCFDMCLKGGLEVYDKPKGDTTGSSVYLLSKLENPPGSDCRCPPAFGNMDADKTTFAGFYSGEPLTLTVASTPQSSTAIYVSWAGCKYVYAVEESFDRDRDGKPDFLGAKGAVKDTIPPIVGTILANAISATVAATIFTNVATAVVEKFLQVLSTKDVQSLAQGIDPEVVGVTGGALVPLLQQAGYLGIIGQIGGQGSVPAVSSRMSEGLAWVNFHLASLTSNTTDSAPAVQKRRNLVASRRRHMRRMGFRLAGANISEANKCAKVETSATNLRSTLSSVGIAIGGAVLVRTRDHVQGILDLDDDDLIAQGRMTFMQFFGFTALTMPSIAGVASKQLAGSKELPTVMKSFMGLGESALEAAVSGCPKYLGGGIVLLVFLALFFLGIVYFTRPGGPVQEMTEYTKTGPQPTPVPYIDLPVSRGLDNMEHAVLELLPGQTIEVAEPPSDMTAAASSSSMPRPPPPPPRGEQVTGSKFGAGVSMQAEVTYADDGRARQTHVEMVTITIGGAAMGAEPEDGPKPFDHNGDMTIEDWVETEQKPPKLEGERQKLVDEIADMQTQIEQNKRLTSDERLDALQKKAAATKDPKTRQQLTEEHEKLKLLLSETKKIEKEKNLMADRLQNFPDAQLAYLQKQIDEKQRQIEEENRSGADQAPKAWVVEQLQGKSKEEDPKGYEQCLAEWTALGSERQRNLKESFAVKLEQERVYLQGLRDETGRKARFGAVEAEAMKLLVDEINAEKENIGWTQENPVESETLNVLREDLMSIVDAQFWPPYVRMLLYVPMLPSIVKQWIINEIVFIWSKRAKEKDPSLAKKDKFVGPMSQFPNFGGHKPKNATAQAFVGRFSALFEDQTAERIYYQIWNYLMLGLQSIFIKTISTPEANAFANLGLKAMDLVLKFILMPHASKTAYFDDILAQALNLLQVGVLAKFIKDKADGLLVGVGSFSGDQAGVLFVGGALAAIGPALFTAMYECFSKLMVLRRKVRLANAKMKDIRNLIPFSRANAQEETRKRIEKALNKAFTAGNKSVNPESRDAPNSVAGVQLSEAEMKKYVKIMADILTAASFPSSAFDGKLVFKAAKEMKNRYLKSLNTAEPRSGTVMGGNMGQGGPNSNEIDPHTDIKCLLEALQTVMNDPSYKDAWEKGGKHLLFGLLGLNPTNLDLSPSQDLNAVVNRLDSRALVQNISRFRKVMQMCSAFDPEKGKEYLRKSKMVLLELPLPEDYTQESLKNYVMGHGVPSKPDESEADTTRDIEEAKVPKEKEEKKIRIKIRHVNQDKADEFREVGHGDTVKISRAPIIWGEDFHEMFHGVYVAKPSGSIYDGSAPNFKDSKTLGKEHYYKMTPKVEENPNKKAHVERTVVVEWAEEGEGAVATVKIAPPQPMQHKTNPHPQMISVLPSAMMSMPSSAPSIQFGNPGQQPAYPGQRPGYPGQQPGYPGQQRGYPAPPLGGPTK